MPKNSTRSSQEAGGGGNSSNNSSQPSQSALPTHRAENRFAHLLQPIRDLTQNWNIDVAAELEEYMQEIGRIAFTQDGVTTLNFAEAALLIQGSACIYSKKVEYLYALVYDTLELLASKRRKELPLGEGGEDVDVTLLNANDDADELLDLDDIKEGKNIDLVEDTRKKFGPMAMVARTPIALLPIDDLERNEQATAATNIVSVKGELLGHRNDYRMNSSVVHPSGALLLTNSDRIFLDRDAQGLPFSSTPMVKRTAAQDQSTTMTVDEIDHHDNHHDDDESYFGGGDAGGGFDDDTDMPMEQNQNQDRRATRANAAAAMDENDPWKLLDPHDNSNSINKPAKKGKTHRLPTVLVLQQKHEKADLPMVRAPLRPLMEFFSMEQGRPLPLNSLVATEFDYLFWPEEKRRNKLRAAAKKKLLAATNTRQPYTRSAVESLFPTEESDQPGLYAVAGTDYDDDFGGVDHGHGFDDEDDDYANNVQRDDVANARGPRDTAPQNTSYTYEDLLQQHISKFMQSAEAYARDTELSRRVREWEERIVPYLEQQEAVGTFDIHETGRQVLTYFKKPDPKSKTGAKETVLLETLASNHTSGDICRMFVSCLQLANSGNVELLVSQRNDEFSHLEGIQLLSRKSIYDDLDAYRAPSLLN